MQSVPIEQVVGIARTLFREAYEGPQEGWSWFTNVEPDAGIFGTIESLTPDRASRAVVPGGHSIAGHVEHLRWSLANVSGTLRGKPWQPDWSASWSVHEVDAERWQKLRADLRDEFNRVLEGIDAREDWSDPMMLTGIFALAPHAAHHLATIREILKVIETTDERG